MKEYKITTASGNETTVQLSDEDAKARGLTEPKKTASKQAAPQNKQAQPADKEG